MSFEEKTFVTEPSLEVLDKLTKAQLLSVTEELGLPGKASMRKPELRRLIVDHFVDNDVFEESVVEKYQLTVPAPDETKRFEMELKLRELELQERQRQREFELEKLRLELEAETKRGSGMAGGSGKFDPSKYIKMVPPFNEKDVDKYFQHFEKVAESLEWPKESWPLLLQSVLKGKSQKAYSALSLADCMNYDTVKAAILKAYELVPEAYRQNFRSLKKQEGQTHVEFAHEKEVIFGRWCTSKKVGEEFDNLRQLILIEEFKRCVPENVKTYLDEKDVETLERAAVLADNFALTHKQKFYKSTSSTSRQPTPQDKKFGPASDHKKTTPGEKSEGKPNRGDKSGLSCGYCKKAGHTITDCWKLKKKREIEASPNALVSSHKGNFVDPPLQQIADIGGIKPPIKSPNEASDFGPIRKEFKPFVSGGFVSLEGSDSDPVPICILRDTGATQSLLLKDVLPFSVDSATGESVLAQGIESGFVDIPLHRIILKSELVSGPVIVGIMPTLPVKGVSLLLGNDLAGGLVNANPCVTSRPSMEEDAEMPEVFPACAVTRAMAKKEALQTAENCKLNEDDNLIDLSETFMSQKDSDPTSLGFTEKPKVEIGQPTNDTSDVSLSRSQLIAEQKNDLELATLFERALSPEEIKDVPRGYFIQNEALMRKWRPLDTPPSDEWSAVYQVVVPKIYRSEILRLAHESPLGGHLGVNKTCDKVLKFFYWPKIRHDVSEHCKTCHTCQIVGKPNATQPVAPLKPIPAFYEPFAKIILDCVGPLPKTKSGNQYLLTIMCAATRFPEAIPLRNIKAKAISKALIKFFTLFGLPQEIQSDQGSNFMSNLFQQVVYQLGAKQIKSSAYHPESQGALERFHSTLKTMIKTYCYDNQNDWDEGIPLLMFAAREAEQESLGFSPFELIFGRTVRGPLKLLKEHWTEETEEPVNLLDYVSKFRDRVTKTCQLAQENLKTAQGKMKTWYDKKAKERSFKPGDKVLVLLPIRGNPLQAKYHGPYKIKTKVGDLNYVVETPDRRKSTQMCHINMLKPYYEREGSTENVAAVEIQDSDLTEHRGTGSSDPKEPPIRLKNSEVLKDLDKKFKHVSLKERQQLKELILKYKQIFSDVPTRTHVAEHDVDVGDAKPIKQHPYRVNPEKRDIMKKEIDYMLENKIIQPSHSNWSSPCVLVPKPDGSKRFCTDYRKVNAVTKSDTFPLPRIEDCIDKIGKAKFVTKVDLLKGYWGVPLSKRAREISAFVTPSGLYEYLVMPFGMKNAPATFQRLMFGCIHEIDGVVVFIDDLIIYSDTWEEHLMRLEQVFRRLAEANLTVNLSKSEFAQATVIYLGHVVGQGNVKPIDAKIQAICEYPAPTTRRSLQRFLGMAGFYRKYCVNFADVANPLTDLLKKNRKFEWTPVCEDAFNKLRALLATAPVLKAPDFQREFKLATDASDNACGAVLLQEDNDGIEHPVGYFSKKLTKHQKNYSTIEKELLAIILALQYFEVYVSSSHQKVTVYTDHNPLTFLNRMKNKNRRLLNWSLLLQEYNLDIKHIKGKDNVIADALSR